MTDSFEDVLDLSCYEGEDGYNYISPNFYVNGGSMVSIIPVMEDKSLIEPVKRKNLMDLKHGTVLKLKGGGSITFITRNF
jgi:hypothetical protein